MTAGQSRQLKRAFLDSFRLHGNVFRACETHDIARSTVYRWRDNDERFAGEFTEAEREATEHMESEAYRRAVEGTEKPVYQNGVCVGYVREYSDTLLIFMLKARAPEKYRENLKVDHSGITDVTIHYVNDWRNPES